MLLKPNKLELTVFVMVNIESLNELSKLRPPAVKILDRMKMLIKKQIKTKKDEFKFSLSILFSVFSILWSIITFGDTSLKISRTVDLKSTYNLKSLIPDEFDKIEPPIIVIKIKSKKKFSGGSYKVRPELLILLTTLKKIFKNVISCIEKKIIKLKKVITSKIKISS